MSTGLCKKFCNSNVKCIPAIYALSIRWATKPRWVPMAKTKIFRPPKQPQKNPVEDVEIQRLKNIYRTQMKSVINHLKEVHRMNETSEDVIAKYELDKEEAWLECMRLNDEWNKAVSIEREKLSEQEFQENVEKAKAFMVEEDEKERIDREKVEKLIREQKELSRTFITKQNIDEHIDKILDSTPFTFNFAVDQQGNIYEGFNSKPSPGKSFVDRTKAEEVQQIAKHSNYGGT